MGKAKKTKCRPDQVLGSRNNTINAATNDLEADLASLDESKRLKACTMLADLYVFNTCNQMSLKALTSSQLLSKLTMRLTDSSANIRIQAAQAFHNLSESKDNEVINRIVNVGLFGAAVSLSMDSAALSVNNGDYVEQLFLSIANIITESSTASHELNKCCGEYVMYLLGLLSLSTSDHVVGAVAHLLAAITSNSASMQQVNAEVTVGRLWSFIMEAQAVSDSQAPDVSIARLVQCSEVLCNVFWYTPFSPHLAQQCHIGEVMAITAQALDRVNSATQADASRYAATKMVASFLLNVLNPASAGSTDSGASLSSVEIEERRAAGAASEPRRSALLQAMNGAGLLDRCYVALNGVESTLKGHIAQCASAAVTSTTAEGVSSESSSVVISAQVKDGFECLERLLTATQQCVLFQAVCGPFALDVQPFVAICQFLLDSVSAFTASVDNNKVESTVWAFAEGVDENALRDSVLGAVTGMLDFLASVAKVSYNSVNGAAAGAPLPAAGSYLFVSEDALKALSLLLVRCSTYSYLELALPAVGLIGTLGQRGDQVVTLPAGGAAIRLALPVSLNGLLTNSVVRRCQDPNAYSSDNSTEGAANLAKSSLLLMDACFNAVIDLHSSDDLSYLDTFIKLKCIEKLQERGRDFAARLRGEAGRRLEGAEREHCEESGENLSNFIEYKQDFIRSSGK